MQNITKHSFFLFSCLLLLLFIGTLASCKSGSVPLTTTIESKTEIVDKTVFKDSIVNTEKDSSSYTAAVESIDGKVTIKEVQKSNDGKHLNRPKVSIKDNVLQVDCYAEAQSLFIQWKERFLSELNTTTTTPAPILIEAPLTIWQTIQIWFGRTLMALIVGIIIYLIIKFF